VGEEDLITPARFEFMTRTLERCTAEGAEAVIFDLDTPGGLAWDTTNLMMRDLQKLGPPSFAFINPRALSAGAMIAVATDAIYIAPAGSAGAATPIYGNGTEMGEAERAKMNSAIMGMARTVAKEKGHDPRVIEAMIDMDRELVVNGQVLCAKGEILTLDAEEATMLSDGKPLFAKAIATSIDEVKAAEKLKGETLTAEPAGFEQIAIWITKYASILILIGIAGAYMEMQAPGFGLPGFVSLIAFSLFFFGHYVAGSLVGHETTVAVAVFMLGILLLAVEFFILPGTIVAGIVGFLCVMGALVFTMSGWEVPPIDPTVTEEATKGFSFNLSTYATGLRNFAIGVTGAGVLLIAFARYLPEFGPFKRMTLATTAGGTLAETPAAISAATVRPGDEGIARSALRPYGTVEIAGRQLEASVDGGYLQSGTTIRVREVQGMKIIVEAI
jgi:membrane-bound serine protease (ClpP class)